MWFVSIYVFLIALMNFQWSVISLVLKLLDAIKRNVMIDRRMAIWGVTKEQKTDTMSANLLFLTFIDSPAFIVVVLNHIFFKQK